MITFGLSPLLAPQLSCRSNFDPSSTKPSGLGTGIFKPVQFKPLGAIEAVCADVFPVLTGHAGVDGHT